MDQTTTTTEVADQNTERLLQAACEPDPVPPAFAAKLEAMLMVEARELAKAAPPPVPARRWGHVAIIAGLLAASVLIGLAFWFYPRPQETKNSPDIAGKTPVNGDKSKKLDSAKQANELDAPKAEIALAKWTDDVRAGMMPRKRPDAPALAALREGQTLATKAGQRRLVQLADGTRLYVNEKTEVESTGPRHLTLKQGQIYLEVAPIEGAPLFTVKAGSREMTATGTHFAVQSDPTASGVVVTQGRVAVKGLDSEIAAGQQVAPASFKVTDAPRASHTLEWTRELMAAAETPMVPACQHAGGALVAFDPQGQEIKLAMRKYHIDVHIEDGFARTTIDQTYFNTTWERLEGTFYFPLPADASLNRLAMYVADANNQCKLMEGGMAERKHAADVYETIRYQRRDPALLEWLDGSTFKMRVFPLEAKQEKRIILSYVQKLPSLYGATRYRFAGGHSLPVVRDWSFTARVKNGAGLNVWSPTHADMQIFPMQQDKFAQFFATNVKPAADVALELHDKNAILDKEESRFATILHEGQQYLMLRYRPTLQALPERQRRDWIVLFEASAQRDPLVAGTQVEVLKNLLKNAEYDDTFTIVTANSKAQVYSDKPQAARPKNVDAAIKALNDTHLIGALDLQQGLEAALKLAKNAKNPHLVHIGSGIPAMGERDAGKLAKMLPESVRYVGVGVGKRWNRAFMKLAAERTSGIFTQINPDEAIAWRAFDLLATLNTPRLLDVQVTDSAGKAAFLMETSMISQGEEICAMTRIGTNEGGLPVKVKVTGRIDGKLLSKEFPVINAVPGAGYLPRAWAKLEIDRLLAANAAQHKETIIALSKASYVMSPYTSLLVLETDADYERFKVDRGRKDHWAMYDCPAKIPLVHEPDGQAPAAEVKVKIQGPKPSVEQVLRTFVERPTDLDSPVSLVLTEEALVRQYAAFQDHTFKLKMKLQSGTKEEREKAAFLDRLLDENRDLAVNHDFAVRVRSLMRPLDASDSDNGVVTMGGSRARIHGLSPKVAGKYHFQLLAEDWGKLPDSASKRKLDDLINDLPANQREAIATYFRVLGHSKDKEKTKDLFAIARKMDNIERRLELRRSGASDEIELHLQLKELMSSLEREQRTTTSLLQKQFRSDLLEEFNELLDPKQPRKVLKRQMDAITKLEAGIEFGMQRPTLAGRGASVPEFMEVTNRIAKGGDVRQYGRFESFGPDQPLLLSGEITAEQTYRRALRLYQAKAISREEMVRAAQQFEDGRVKATAPLVIYERPPFEYDRTFFTDLLQYAPGLHPTAADIRATLDAEADVEEPKVGKIDADALKLIDKARSTSWLELSVPAEGPIPGYVIRYNGIGQFAYERMLGSGLREQVVCDGTTLWHLYPEIGLVAKRPFSRHHQSLIASINPAYVPAAGELSRGCDVKSVNATTIALIPLRSALGTEYSVLHFVFAADGRLSERRVVEMPSGKTLARQIFSADGSIEWKDKEDKSVAKIARKLDSSKAPELTPNLKDLVVMTMPIRSQEHIVAQARKRGVDPDADHDTTVERFIAACMRGDPYFDKGATMGRLFQNGKERRIGLFTLLHAANASLAVKQLHGPDGKTFSVDFEKVHPNNALAMFLSQCQHEVNHNDPSAYKKVAGPSDGFIQRLSAFRNVWRSWHHQRPIANGGADLPTELSRVIDFLETTPSPVFAYAVLDAMQRRCSRAPSDHMMQIAVKRFAPISHPLGLGYVFRYEEARSLWQAGKGAAAARAFTELHADTVKLGVLPPIDTAFRDVTKTWGDGKFVAFTRKTADELLAQKQYGLTFQLAQQIDKLGDEALRDDILATILDAAPKEDRNALSLISVRYLVDRKSYVQADRILAKVLDDKKLAEHPELWRWRSEIAGNFGQTATSLAALEKALDLEYAELPELVNLESIRTDYRTLLGHYQRIADAHASLDQPAPKEFLAKVVRAADRWRLIDADGSEPCRLAGKIMHTLRQRDLAWDYWTTPIDLHPAESRPWLEFADILQGEGDLERADRAFALAFEAEQTNPEILWKRAQNHVRMGQTSEARRLYRQIVEGTWQERFAVTVEQAKGLAGN